MAYPETPLATFPDGYISVPKLTAPSSAEAALIVQYNEALEQGDYATCQQILTNNPNLNNCRITVDAYNTIIDEIKSIEIYYNQEVGALITGLAASKVGIDDSTPSPTNAYSSSKIEAMIGRMNHIAAIEVPASGWSLSNGEYLQTVTITTMYPGTSVTSTDTPEIYYNSANISADDAEQYAEECAYIYNIATGSNVLNLKAYDLPTMTIYIDAKGI